MQLSSEQIDKLWGETGPYSQVNLIIQTRILDDKVSRIFLVVEAEINPFTFELIKKRREYFKDDMKIMQLLDNAEYRGLPFGYVVCTFEIQYTDERALEEAQKRLECTRETIIRMHRFVMDLLDMQQDKQKFKN